ncbi:MAG: hypothetical protein ACHP7D_00565 [Lysobacterales bacterium]
MKSRESGIGSEESDRREAGSGTRAKPGTDTAEAASTSRLPVRGRKRFTPCAGISPMTWAVVGCGAVALLRLHECLQIPVETGDVVRNLLYGVLANEHGFSAATKPLLAFSPDWSQVSWARFPFSYPPVALAFFALVAAISPTVFCAKILLTLLEAANAVAIGRLSGSRLLGILYWASPMSIWWVSREGQFEPLQSFLMLMSLLAVARFPFVCGLALALAIFSKITAVLLLPLIVILVVRTHSASWKWASLGFVVGTIPALISELTYQGVSNVLRFGALLVYNPYYWNPFADMFAWNPPWLIAVDQIATYGMLAALAIYAWRSGAFVYALAPIAFIVLCKTHTNVQFWYFLLLPAFLVTIPHAKWRAFLIAVCPLLDIRSTLELIAGPLGQFGYHGLPGVLDAYRIY